MRAVILKMSMTLDGFVAGPGGEIGWIFGGDRAAVAWSIENASRAGLHIMGSRTFATMAAHWPTASDGFARTMNEVPKAVFSGRGHEVLQAAHDPETGRVLPGAESWAAAYVAAGDLRDEVAKLKSTAGKPIIAHGGAAFARSLIAADLIDEYVLTIHPIALGNGLPIWTGLAEPRRLELVSSQPFPGGALAQVYRPARVT